MPVLQASKNGTNNFLLHFPTNGREGVLVLVKISFSQFFFHLKKQKKNLIEL
jgi:hypothetical protein